MRHKKAILIGAGLLLLLAAVLAADFVVNRVAKERFDRELAHLENRIEVHYETLRFNFWSGNLRAGQVSATVGKGQLKLLADHLQIRDWERDPESGLVAKMGITGTGVRIYGRGENGGWIPKLKGYGYDDPKLGLELDYSYQPQTRTLVVDRLKVGGKEMGAFDLQGRFTDVAAVDWGRLGEGMLMQRMAALGSLKIAGLQLEYNDFGLLPRVFDQRATASGKTAPEVANEVYASIDKQKSLRLTPVMLESIRKFLTKPDRIELVMQPAKPVGTMEWITALLFRGDLVKLLGVDIRT